ncbi:hypothetical protein MSC49_03080 [Methylosinus sp. C49]|uniref:hypothetical protein n=1 Tax=Methylosinus sp. C49 TaxID=2699395 RepID=UPI00136777AD|nr:hypothetical protein [Methylosinus sp. C49]BBU60373.1 hypothetical protein MSC49_03080 [Methylosinus sp. C49]
MSAFDYGMEAGLFSSKTLAKRSRPYQNSVEFRRFAQAAEAIRYAVEDMPAALLGTCSLEVAEATYTGAAIRSLYESAEFPLPRRIDTAKK